MLDVLADPALYGFIGGAPPTLEELEARFSRWAQGSPRPGEVWHNWVVRLDADGVAIGHAQATVTGAGHEADVAWLIGTAWQGQGYASEAARAVVRWLESRGLRRITARVHPAHVASGRVAASAGLAPTDELQDGEVVWRRVR